MCSRGKRQPNGHCLRKRINSSIPRPLPPQEEGGNGQKIPSSLEKACLPVSRCAGKNWASAGCLPVRSSQAKAGLPAPSTESHRKFDVAHHAIGMRNQFYVCSSFEVERTVAEKVLNQTTLTGLDAFHFIEGDLLHGFSHQETRVDKDDPAVCDDDEPDRFTEKNVKKPVIGDRDKDESRKERHMGQPHVVMCTETGKIEEQQANRPEQESQKYRGNIANPMLIYDANKPFTG